MKLYLAFVYWFLGRLIFIIMPGKYSDILGTISRLGEKYFSFLWISKGEILLFREQFYFFCHLYNSLFEM